MSLSMYLNTEKSNNEIPEIKEVVSSWRVMTYTVLCMWNNTCKKTACYYGTTQKELATIYHNFVYAMTGQHNNYDS